MWDFSHIFPTREAFEKEFSDCSKEIDAIGNIKDFIQSMRYKDNRMPLRRQPSTAYSSASTAYIHMRRCTKKRIIPTPKIRSSKHVLPGFM